MGVNVCSKGSNLISLETSPHFTCLDGQRNKAFLFASLLRLVLLCYACMINTVKGTRSKCRIEGRYDEGM